MRIAVCNLATGGLDILIVDKETEKIFDKYDDAEDFFKDLGYDIDYISWMVLENTIQEVKVTHNLNIPVFEE